MNFCAAVLSVFTMVVSVAAPAQAGITDSPLPVFADGKPSVQVLVVPGVVKRGRLQTDFLCTSIDSAPVNIGVEIFAETGALLNDVGAGVGAVLDVAPGQTVTIGTSATAAFLETAGIPLAEVKQGTARVVASSARVQCSVLIVDDAITPPVTLGTLGAGVRPAAGTGLVGRALPQFEDGRAATHAAVFPGVVKRGRVETVVFCASLAAESVALGVEVFGPDGTRLNDVGAGNGAVLDVPPGATVTLGTTGTMAFLETAVIVLPGVAQGAARVVSTTDAVLCAAQVVDSGGTPPTAMTELRGYAVAAPSSTPTLSPTPVSTATPTRTQTPTLTGTPTATGTPINGCTGDCNGNGVVAVDELVTGLNMALGAAPVDICPEFDVDGDESITVDELVRSVAAAVNGCIVEDG